MELELGKKLLEFSTQRKTCQWRMERVRFGWLPLHWGSWCLCRSKAVQPRANLPEIKSIAVLPSRNLSGDRAQEYLPMG